MSEQEEVIRFAESNGWSEVWTGGNCTGLERDLGSIVFLITDDAETPYNLGDNCIMGIYRETRCGLLCFAHRGNSPYTGMTARVAIMTYGKFGVLPDEIDPHRFSELDQVGPLRVGYEAGKFVIYSSVGW